MMPLEYVIRIACSSDRETLDRIYTKNMQEYVELHYPWNPTLFEDNFVPQDYQIIEVDSQTVGFFKVVTSKAEIYLAEIQIARKFQNLGIGSSIVSKIISQARLNRQRLWLRVIKGNPAEKLYRKLGFTTLAVDSTHIKLQIKS